MNIFKKIFGKEVKTKSHMRAPFTSTISQRYGYASFAGLSSKDFLKEYRNWVFACVQARSEEVGNIKLRLMKDGEEIFEHEILDLINKVNPTMTKHELFEATQAFKDLEGNAYWYLARDGKDGTGKIREIYVLSPDKMRIVLDKSNPLTVEGYLYTQPDGQTIPFTPSEILHHKNFNPKGSHPFPHKGMGIVEAAAFAIETDNEARNWNLNFFKNGARPDGILYTEGDAAVDSDEYNRIKEEWEEEHQGSDNAHKISVLSGGIKYQELTRNQKDMDFLGQRTFSRDEILALFRTPKSIVGITDDVNRANAEASVYVFALRTIKPLMQKLVDTLNEFLLPNFNEEGLKFDFVSPVTEDRIAVINEYTNGYNRWLSRNDIRRKEGLIPTEEGESLYGDPFSEPNDKTPVPDPIKSMSTKKPIKKSTQKEEVEKAVDGVSKKSIAEKSLDKFIASLPQSNKQKNAHRKGLTDDQKKTHIDEWNKRMENIKPLKRKINDFFAKQKEEVLNNLKDEMKGLDAKEFKYKALEDVLFDNGKAVSTAISFMTPFIEQYIKDSGKAGNESAQGEGFNFDEKRVQDFIPKRAKYFADSINNTTREDLLKSIQEGIDSQESLDDISKRIADIYNKAQDYRTDTIARTEVAASSNFGAIEAYKQAGVEDHQWVVVSPDDDDCLVNEGQVVKIGEPFENGDTDPPVHPNCQCTTVPIFND